MARRQCLQPAQRVCHVLRPTDTNGYPDPTSCDSRCCCRWCGSVMSTVQCLDVQWHKASTGAAAWKTQLPCPTPFHPSRHHHLCSCRQYVCGCSHLYDPTTMSLAHLRCLLLHCSQQGSLLQEAPHRLRQRSKQAGHQAARVRSAQVAHQRGGCRVGAGHHGQAAHMVLQQQPEGLSRARQGTAGTQAQRDGVLEVACNTLLAGPNMLASGSTAHPMQGPGPLGSLQHTRCSWASPAAKPLLTSSVGVSALTPSSGWMRHPEGLPGVGSGPDPVPPRTSCRRLVARPRSARLRPARAPRQDCRPASTLGQKGRRGRGQSQGKRRWESPVAECALGHCTVQLWPAEQGMTRRTHTPRRALHATHCCPDICRVSSCLHPIPAAHPSPYDVTLAENVGHGAADRVKHRHAMDGGVRQQAAQCCRRGGPRPAPAATSIQRPHQEGVPEQGRVDRKAVCTGTWGRGGASCVSAAGRCAVSSAAGTHWR